jgi:hypothetical protein
MIPGSNAHVNAAAGGAARNAAAVRKGREPRGLRVLRAVASLILLIVVAAFVPPVRHAILRGLAGILVIADPVQPADVGVMTESGDGGEIEVSQLYHQGVFPRVLVLAPARTAVDDEYVKLGVHRGDLVLTTLRQLGVPDSAVMRLDAGEGGTTDSTRALATWVLEHPGRVLVVISPTHARRYRRTLMRVWPDGVPSPRVTVPHVTLFHVEDWWRSRRTLREGLFELQKLAWDYVRHPRPGR